MVCTANGKVVPNGLNVSVQERTAQKEYWKMYAPEASVEAMMLDSNATEIDREERPEVLAMLGNIDNKRVVELGAGIGRFTGPLAASAKSVLAFDFMEHLIQENIKTNGDRGNVKCQVADVTELDLPEASADVVFSNWLLMYLSDEECSKLARDALRWLTEGGILFFRESCFRQSGDVPRKANPSHYRNPREYFAIMDSARVEVGNGLYAHFELVSCKCVDAYVRHKANANQICWKWRKVVSKAGDLPAFRDFLDTQQYSENGILRYEKIFGPGFVSTGGIETTREFVGLLDLREGQTVLDVGCGIGGGDFFMAEEYGAAVHGIDLSVNMVLIALERASQRSLRSKVSFEIADVTSCELLEGAFDVVYSRDTILHISDKPALFRRLLKALKPGGTLLISDYCRAEGQPSPGFAEYIAQRGYDLQSVAAYGDMLSKAGFIDVLAEDRTWQFQECLKRELQAARQQEAAFVREFSKEDFNHLVHGWEDKLVRSGEGEQRWGLFRARRPLSPPGPQPSPADVGSVPGAA